MYKACVCADILRPINLNVNYKSDSSIKWKLDEIFLARNEITQYAIRDTIHTNMGELPSRLLTSEISDMNCKNVITEIIMSYLKVKTQKLLILTDYSSDVLRSTLIRKQACMN